MTIANVMCKKKPSMIKICAVLQEKEKAAKSSQLNSFLQIK